MARKEELGQDSEGRYRRYLGWKIGEGGKLVQHLFRLGRDKDKARLANLRLEELWRAVCGHCKDGKPQWDATTLAIGQAIAKGETVCVLIPPIDVAPSVAVEWLGLMQQWFPIIPLRLPSETMRAGVEEAKERQEILDKSRRIHEALLSGAGAAPSQTLHQALDAYKAYLEEKYINKPSLRHELTCIALIRRHHPDTGLNTLDADGIETCLAYWCRRPQGRGGKTLAPTTCRNILATLRRFLRWLARSPRFDWTLPGGFTFPRYRLARTPQDNVRRRMSWRVEELRTLWQYAKPWDRALILLALNCGFSKREIATLQLGEIVKGAKHTFIKRHRMKTGVYGEWVLWPETVQALEYLAQFRPSRASHVVANRNGQPLTRQSATGGENSVIRNHWDLMLRRVLEDFPHFHTLSFKYLRKTGATLLRHLHIRNAAELASMYLAHGEAADSRDALLAVYTSRPWRKLHKALLVLRKKLLPVFTSVPNPWESAIVKISPATVVRVKELRAGGMTLKEIAAKVGLHKNTVGKLCRPGS